ncbi:uncharacterized protein L3040_001517 [Drepanopeziza brunnea f. sp. 'multigermtubi']|uniref:uncharacterized protein n=1 Tax=Drepanopeziza brunnea f. sp. 'multigermtubi' TaxID=698441 RepID=UPI00239372AE|nr:hypothetical protein L3040_001517 [Drepanopeziza brunnea f. sp. 'multigermtubi']
MPPPVNQYQQGADAGRYRSPIEPGSSLSSGSGSMRQSSDYSSSAQGGPTTTDHRPSSGSYHSHPEAPRPYGSSDSLMTGARSSPRTLSHRPNAPATTQSKLSTFGYGPERSDQKFAPNQECSSSRSDHNPNASSSQSHASPLMTNGAPRLQSQSAFGPSRFGYLKKKQAPSQPQQGSLSNSPGDLRNGTLPASKAPFRASANVAHPFHYQQSPLQFSVTPDRPPQVTPRSQLQVVIGTQSSASFYKNSPLPSYSAPARLPRSSPLANARESSQTPKKRGRPALHKTPVEKTPKKRGRPFASGEAAIQIAKKQAEKAARKAEREARRVEAKNKGQPWKLGQQPNIEQPEPIFYPFICEWDGCARELQNLETLRLHVHIVHEKRVDGKLQCLWAKCGRKKKVVAVVTKEHDDDDAVDEEIAAMAITENEIANETHIAEKSRSTCPAFARKQDWLDHLEEEHFIPFSWHMGDGPKATDLSAKPKGVVDPLWLNDSKGNQVTPSVAGQSLEEGRPGKNNAKRFRKMRGVEVWAIKQPKELKGMAMAPPIPPSSEDDDDTGVEAEGEDTGMDDVDLLRVAENRREIADSDDSDDSEKGVAVDMDGDVQMG